MSKKDYIAIATALVRAYNDSKVYKDIDRLTDNLIDNICEVLKNDNAKFDEDKFYTFIEERMK